ncbi:MAG TPA: response regulator transcription factor [Actinomycetota bacterium]|nr:response regulator transcription factor [Actinomycetota bacterium]
MNEGSITVLLIDDHVVVREGLRLLLEREPGVEVMAEASSLAEALAVEEQPEVVLADLMLPDEHGRDVVVQLRERFPRSAILVLTMVDNALGVRQAFEAGATGYLLKEAASEELVNAVRCVASGERYVQSPLRRALAERPTPPPRHAPIPEPRLSARELEVLTPLAFGHTNAEVASVLSVSRRTVETHRANLQRKLRIRSRADLTRYAVDQGLITLG